MNQDNPLPGQTESNSKNLTPTDFWTVFFLCLFLGVFGAHRFYAQKYKIAVIQLLTCGGLGFWAILDLLLILVDSFQNEKGMYYRNPKPGLSWLIVIVIFGLSIWRIQNEPGRRHHSAPGGPVTSSHLNLSAFGQQAVATNSPVEQLITTDARDKFGDNAVVQIEGPGTNGTYEVTVRSRDRYGGIKSQTYNVTLDPSGQKVASWQ
jgi:hypothetical protein